MHASIGISSVVVLPQAGHVSADSRTGGCDTLGRLAPKLGGQRKALDTTGGHDLLPRLSGVGLPIRSLILLNEREDGLPPQEAFLGPVPLPIVVDGDGRYFRWQYDPGLL
jgi:hypothetical protein